MSASTRWRRGSGSNGGGEVTPRTRTLHQLLAILALLMAHGAPAEELQPATALSGAAAFGDWRQDAPGVRRHITAADLPEPFATPSAGNSPKVVAAKPGALPKVPPGFQVALLDTGLKGPRLLRVAPNGDIFVAEMEANRVRVLRLGADHAKVTAENTFAKIFPFPLASRSIPRGPTHSGSTLAIPTPWCASPIAMEISRCEVLRRRS